MTTPAATDDNNADLESLVSQLLQEVGVLNPTNDAICSALLFHRMDQWLGLEEDSTAAPTAEDCAPFSGQAYALVATMLEKSWNPSNSLLPNSNVFIQELHRLQQEGATKEEDIAQKLTLDCVPAFRVTRWIRQWMEYNVEAPSSSSGEGSSKSFSHYLLLGNDHNAPAAPYAESLMQALIVHMTLLPTFQSQLLLFNQAFQRGDFRSTPPKNKNVLPTSGTTALADPTQRLQHYQLAQQFAQKLTRDYDAHLERLEFILGDWYSVSPPTLRSLARAGLSRIWMKFCGSNASPSGGYNPSLRGENTTATGLDVSLRILYRVLLGLKQPQTAAILEDLLFHQLLPLHQPNAMVLWRDQTSLLELYHEPLVQCMAFCLKQQPAWIAPVCQALLLPSESIWPVGGNTPKQVLLLHQVDTFLGMLVDKQPQANFMDEATFVSILQTVAQCMASEHSRLAERALTLLRNAYFKQCVMETYLEASLRVLLPVLTRSTKATNASTDQKNAVPWNPTVRKMTFHVLKNLQTNNPTVFGRIANELFGNAPVPAPKPPVQQAQPQQKSSLLSSKKQENHNPSSNPAFNQRFSLQAGMGDWRPPPSAKSKVRHNNMPPPSARPPKTGAGGGTPPLSITGVAPWSSSGGVKKNPPSTITGVAPWANKGGAGKKNPPATITGVAPWAMGGGGKPPPPSKANPPGRGKAPWTTGRLPPSANPQRPMPPPPAQQQILPPLLSQICGSGQSNIVPPAPTPPPITEEEEDMEDDAGTNAKNNPGLAHVLQYMEHCKPPGMDENEDEHASSSWSKAQMAETPTLLPDLKFHDLVFGQELGKGAFGVVKYARLIDRTKTRSHWDEYAVKVIATERMKELGYEYSVAREIASLRLIGHPNVARLVSSFRFQQGAYLVLEYASGGDLHQLLQQHGSLDVPSSQFVLGEIVAALASIHDAGFLYGDLKPENCVLSETGHVKLTDFGACRPFTDGAKSMLKRQMGKSGHNLLGALREGDPRKYNNQNKLAVADEESVEVQWGMNEEDEEKEEESGWGDSKERTKTESKPINDDTMEVVDNTADHDHKEDLRIEGTTAYLPPEVVLGSLPTPAADSWALGCVLYQCLSGRPPILEADESKTRSKIVTFDSAESDPLFGPDQKHAADIPDNAKALIRSLLDRVSHQRPSMQQAAEHAFFEGQDVMRLYQKQAHPLDVGGVAPAPPDAQWSRRQFSSIWAPQPQAYDISGAAATSKNANTANLSSPIPEGDEAGAPFTPSHFYRVSNMQATSATQSSSKVASSSAPTNGGDLAQQPLAQIEEDDVSMASSTEERMQH